MPPNRFVAASTSRRQSSTRTRSVSIVDGVAAELLRERVAVLRRAPAQDDLGAFRDIERGDRRTKPLRAAGDDRDFARQGLTHRP